MVVIPLQRVSGCVGTGREASRCACHNVPCVGWMTSPVVAVEAAPLKPGAAVTSAGVCLQCTCGGTEEATRP